MTSCKVYESKTHLRYKIYVSVETRFWIKCRANGWRSTAWTCEMMMMPWPKQCIHQAFINSIQ